MKRVLSVFLTIIILMSASKKDTQPEAEDPASGKISFNFHHYCDGQELIFDQRIYTNEAGNEYMVNEIQYFISDVKLVRDDGSYYRIHSWKEIHYVDTDIPETMVWQVYDDIPATQSWNETNSDGHYSGISFTFGISEEKNQSLMFVDPPESLMFWPEYLGGGYHYMKLNGKWLNTNDLEVPFDFHLGIGQIYHPNSGEITGFIQNYFTIDVQAPSFILFDGQEISISLVMHVDRWFKDPHTYDHNEWGGDIMQTQAAMKLGCENGHDVFEVLGVGLK